MHLVPTQEEVVALLRDTGALRDGHFEYPNGLHANEYLQVALAMRYYQHARTLSVGLSRLLRANTELRAMIPELSIVAPATGGLPVAYGVCEALRAHQVYWGERDEGVPGSPLPAVPAAEAGREGPAGRRHSAHRQQADGIEEAGRKQRRRGGGPGRDDLPADPQDARLSTPCRSTTSPSSTPSTPRTQARCDLCKKGSSARKSLGLAIRSNPYVFASSASRDCQRSATSTVRKLRWDGRAGRRQRSKKAQAIPDEDSRTSPVGDRAGRGPRDGRRSAGRAPSAACE